MESKKSIKKDKISDDFSGFLCEIAYFWTHLWKSKKSYLYSLEFIQIRLFPSVRWLQYRIFGLLFIATQLAFVRTQNKLKNLVKHGSIIS